MGELTAALALTPALRDLGSAGAYPVLAVATAAATVSAAILAEVAAWIHDEPRWSWMAAAFALYGLVALPVTTLATDGDTPHLLLLLLVVHLTALPLLAGSLRTASRHGSALPWGLTVVGAVLSTASLTVPEGVVPVGAVAVVLVAVVLPGAVVVALCHLVAGHRRRNGSQLRLGLGLVVVTGAQLHRGAAGLPVTHPPSAVLGLVGALVVLVALVELVARSLATLNAEHWAQQEELSQAALHVERARESAAERDHELRNGLAGLAGITHLLGSGADDDAQQRLKQAVLSELGRLHTILDGGAVGPDRGPREEYAVEPVLAGLVTLRRSGGAAVTLEVDDGDGDDGRADLPLRVCGDAAVLAQVVTNLLANCERHAPGAAVVVRARRRGDRVLVEVRDRGPGLPAALEHALLRRGVHDPRAGGSGLGLHISARLVEREGGALDLRTVTDPLGCLATVQLPAASAPDRPGAHRSPHR